MKKAIGVFLTVGLMMACVLTPEEPSQPPAPSTSVPPEGPTMEVPNSPEPTLMILPTDVPVPPEPTLMILPTDVPVPPVVTSEVPPTEVPISEPSAANLLVNGDMEDGDHVPQGWSVDAWTWDGVTFTWDDTQAFSGRRSVKIENAVESDARWIQTVGVLPNTSYRLSAWVKTQDVAHTVGQPADVGANVSVLEVWNHSTCLFGTNDWTRVVLLFSTGEETRVTVALRLGFYSSTTTGVAWFDDVRLEEMSVSTGLQNPGAELGSHDQPLDWQSESLMGSASFAWDDSTARSGSRSLKVSSSEQSIAGWTQVVQVEQDTEYEFSGWIKTQDVQGGVGTWGGTGAKLVVRGEGSMLAASTHGIAGTQDWTRASVRFVTGSTDRARVSCATGEIGAYGDRLSSAGAMWCDDLALTKVRKLERAYMEGAHVALDLYAEDLAAFDDPATYVAHLDEVYEAMADLVDGVPFGGDVITVRSDATIFYGMLAGNPIIIGPGSGLAEWVDRHGIDFGVPHELGHDFDLWPQAALYMGTEHAYADGEHWANLKVLYAFDVLGEKHPELTMEMWGQTMPLGQVGQAFDDCAVNWIESGRTDYENNDCYTGLNYVLVQRVGWEPFKRAFRAYRSLYDAVPVPGSDLEKVELWANLLSVCAGEDLVPAFVSWGFPIETYGEGELTLLRSHIQD